MKVEIEEIYAQLHHDSNDGRIGSPGVVTQRQNLPHRETRSTTFKQQGPLSARDGMDSLADFVQYLLGTLSWLGTNNVNVFKDTRASARRMTPGRP